MFELATLGLLQQQPLHGYRLKQELELFMSSCISVNYGTIYPLLKRLEQRGAIRITELAEAGCARKVYSITPMGRSLWKQLMMDYPHESWVNARSRFMIKLFFFSHLASVERLQLLNQRLAVCQQRDREIRQTASADDRYQAIAFAYHLGMLQSEIEWLETLIQQELALSREGNPMVGLQEG